MKSKTKKAQNPLAIKAGVGLGQLASICKSGVHCCCVAIPIIRKMIAGTSQISIRDKYTMANLLMAV